jgi:hypothetical protein
MLRLLVTHGPEEQIFALPDGVAKLGSAGENDIVLRIPGISRRHALVRRHSGGVEINDLGSRNGLLVEGQRVRRAALTPELRIQIGAAWLEVEEVSTSEEAFTRLSQSSSGRPVSPSPMTASAEPLEASRSLSSEQAALTLAYHISQVGVGIPEKRADLLLRIKATLGAEAFATLERTRSGRLRIWEIVGTFSPAETKLLTPLAGDRRTTARDAVVLKREGKILLSGRDAWFLAAKFAEETLAREGWRKEFLRFLASQFFLPVRSLDDLDAAEAARVRGLTRGNKKRAAELLGICRNTMDKLLRSRGLPKRSKL